MSIFFEFDVGPTGRRFRRAVDQDKKDIELFWNRDETKGLFYDIDIGTLIELATLSICLIDENKDVTGFIALCDHPNVPGVDPAHWDMWITNMFQRYYQSRNTLFIHFMCCVDSVEEFFLEEALVSIFLNDMHLSQIAFIVPPGCPIENVMRYQMSKKRNFFKFYARGDDFAENYHYLQVAMRQDFCPKLKTRRAVEEDNDDVVEILDAKCPLLKDLYGDYYISEILGRHPESKRQIVVAQFQDRAVGVMCLNADVNYDNLQAMYQLESYHGLLRATPLEKEKYKRENILLKTFGDPIVLGKWSPFNQVPELKGIQIDDDAPSRERLIRPKNKQINKVNFRAKKVLRHSLEHIHLPHDSLEHATMTPHSFEHIHVPHSSEDFSEKFDQSPTNSQMIGYSASCILDEDPFDYDIVNIDSSLLFLPEVSSYDFFSKRPPPRAGKKLGTTLRNRKKKNTTKIEPPPPKFSGAPNAFIIEIYGLREDIDERRGFDLLEAAFECMKIYDYCLIRVPTSSKTFPLLQHFTFVPTRATVCCKYALYLAHRNSVLGKLRVRKAEIVDIPQIAILLQNLDAKETLWTVEHSIVDTKQHQTYVFVSGLSLVGLAITEPPEQIDYMRAKFTVDLYQSHQYHASGHAMNSGYSTLKSVLVYPAFETHFRFFCREIMRLAGSSSLIWMTHYRNKWIAHKANGMASAMIPILPRKSTLAFMLLTDIRKHTHPPKNSMPFSMWYIGKKFTSVPKVNVDTRIVIVGASRTALSFLNCLLFGDSSTYLTFTSVTLVSPHGLPYTRHSNTAAEMMFPKHRTYSDRFLKSTPYTYYVNVVHGTLVEIDNRPRGRSRGQQLVLKYVGSCILISQNGIHASRHSAAEVMFPKHRTHSDRTLVEIDKQEKNITLDNGNKFFYDLLFLLFGKQYQHPDYMEALLERDRQFKSNPTYVPMDQQRNVESEPHVMYYDTPENVFIINSMANATKALAFVRSLLWQNDNNFKVLVYGETIEAYCCLSALLEINVPAENIVFIEPFPPEDESKPRVPIFCNTNVDQTLREVLDTLNVTVYRSYYFRSWECDFDNLVSHVEFLSYFQAIRLECDAFFYYGKRGINPQAFYAINKCGLPYDDGILIDHEFRTKDPSIYAAGPVTTYNRRYFADTKRQKYYDSSDVGEKLGVLIKNLLDPLFTEKQIKPKSVPKCASFDMTTTTSRECFEKKSSSNTSSQTSFVKETAWRLPELKKPIEWHCTLPGNLQYLEVRPPGKKVPHQYVQSLQYNGFVMETFKKGYFKLHFTSDYIVDGITCLTPEKYCLENFKSIYGLSAVTLNNVHLRYSSHRLDDLYTFFRSPWAIYLYHEQLDELLAMVKELVPKDHIKGRNLEEALRCVAEKIECCAEDEQQTKKEKMRSNFEKSAHFAAITDFVIDWLTENDILLPMYLQPRQVVEFSHDLGRHPAFRKRKLSITKILSQL